MAYTYQGEKGTFEYEVVKKPIRQIKMVVREGTAVVSAPTRCNISVIHRFVNDHADWVFEQIARRAASKETIANGETITVLGAKRKLIIGSGRSHAVMTEDTLTVTVTNPDDESIVLAGVDQFFYKLAKEQFAASLDRILKRAKAVGLDFDEPQIFVRKMTTRWGSCTSAKGTIRMNQYLIRMDEKYIDYVMAHELCHLKEANHGAGFYALLIRIMPDCMERRKALHSVDVRNYTY